MFYKNSQNSNIFSKALYLRSLTEFWIHSSLSKYSLTCRVTLSYVLYETYSESCLLPEIQTYSGIFTSYFDKFSHIVAYVEPCVTLAYSEPWYVQNPGLFRTQDLFRSVKVFNYSSRTFHLSFLNQPVSVKAKYLIQWP